MKKQTAAQIRAAQAVVDREEAIEAERERRRFLRARKAREARTAWLSARVSQFRGAASVVGRFFWYLLGQIVQVVVGSIVLISVLHFFMTGSVYPDVIQRLRASIELAFTFWVLILERVPEVPGGILYVVLAFLPWYLAFILFLLALKFAVFPLIRFIIQKLQH